MPKIENVSWDDVKHGWHTKMGDDAVLIQISDPATFFPTPKEKFGEIHRFEFLDIDNNDKGEYDDECLVSEEQAQKLVQILLMALEENKNVLVHCFAGICRSGAVTEVATMLGFEATNRYRQPNLRVKHLMMKSLGWTYDSQEPYNMVPGQVSIGDGQTISFEEYLE